MEPSNINEAKKKPRFFEHFKRFKKNVTLAKGDNAEMSDLEVRINFLFLLFINSTCRVKGVLASISSFLFIENIHN